MIILSKKRIIFICVAMLLSLSVYVGKEMKENTNILETIATPVVGKTIIVDAGHGLPDGGAVGSTATMESDINLKIALKLKKEIEESGNKCIMTRSDENGISGLVDASIRKKHIEDLKNRAKIGNESNADIFISIHLNKISEEKYNGWQTFYRKNDIQGRKLAEEIQNTIKESTQRENKRKAAKISGIYIIDNVNIPITIVECGFLSNLEEEKLLNTDEYQQKLALRYISRNDAILFKTK